MKDETGYVHLKRKMPIQKPGKSEQVVGTPRKFIAAVEKRWGTLDWDLAATSENAKAPKFFTPEDDSLAQDWSKLQGLLWLNPPYANIEDWVTKAALTLGVQDRVSNIIFILIPAAVSTNYFKNYIFDKARVYFLSPRLTFEGQKNSYPKDLMLCVYGTKPGVECWRWDKE